MASCAIVCERVAPSVTCLIQGRHERIFQQKKRDREPFLRALRLFLQRAYLVKKILAQKRQDLLNIKTQI